MRAASWLCTEEGKKRSSLNALKAGLTGRTVLLPGEDAAAYRAHCQNWVDAYQPAGHDESELVQCLADTRWRQDRAFALEVNLFALGRVEFSELFSQELPEVRNTLIQAHTFRAYHKEFRNLITQQGRLDRCFHRDLAKLHELQQQRKQAEALRAAQLRKAATAYTAATKERKPFHSAQETRSRGPRCQESGQVRQYPYSASSRNFLEHEGVILISKS